MHDWTGSTVLLRPKLPVAQLQLGRAQNSGRRLTCRLTALGSLQHCRELRVLYHSQRHTGLTNPRGASEDCHLRIRLHEDFYICITSSGRCHSGFIRFAFQDTTGASTTYEAEFLWLGGPWKAMVFSAYVLASYHGILCRGYA